jgi:3-hydroxyisobutyrate dehydrogenase-like beta-hydroxyacid dehydrogenase
VERTEDDGGTVGVVGVGLLGLAIVERLVAAGWAVLAWDAASDRREAARTLGARPAEGSGDPFDCRTVVLALPTSEVAWEVLAAAPDLAGRTVVDTTTGDPVVVERIAGHVAARGGSYIDATVAGSSEMVRRGEALALVGGDPNAVARCDPVLDAIARRRFYLGPAGAGSRMKLVVNLVLGLNRAALAEGLALARAYGMDLGRALEVLKAGPAYSKAMETKGPKMVSGEYRLEARLAQHHKDVRLILKEALRLGARTPLTEVHERLLAVLVERGLGGEDNAAIFRAFDQAATAPPSGTS